MNKTKQNIKKFFQIEEMSLLLAFMFICAMISFMTPTFLTENNIMNILRQVSLTAIAAFGIALLLLLGEIDLSIGSQQAMIGILAVYTVNTTGSVFLAIIASIALGALIGLINGFLSVRVKIGSFIVTLGMMLAIRGLSMVVTDAKSIKLENELFAEIGTGYIGFIPIPVIVMLVLFFVINYTLTSTVFGRNIYAVGGNNEAAKLAGLPVNKIRITCFIISGMCTAMSAVILASRLASAQPNAGTGFEMKVISAVVLGGVSMTGGRGKLTSAFIGVLILGVLSNGLTLLQVSSFWQDFVSGVVTIFAVYLDVRRRDKSAKSLVVEINNDNESN